MNRSTASELHERRRFPRSDRVPATAFVVSRDRYAGCFLVENLSAGGALLIGDPRMDPPENVRLLLQVQGGPLFSLKADVLRREVRATGEHVFAVAFRDLSLEDAQRLEQLVRHSLAAPARVGEAATAQVEAPQFLAAG